MTTQSSAVHSINVLDLVEQLGEHSLYAHVSDEDSLRIFMRAHVFAVWDFQSLLKALQRSLTCVDVPWLPTVDTEARRLINEIVLDEESDIAPRGGYLSHFELYLEAMQDAGADTTPMETFLADLRQRRVVDEALARTTLPRGVAIFVKTTLDIARSDQVHRIAAAFTYGREEVIPAMFRRLVESLAQVAPERWSTFRYYLTRHIDHDAEKHGPLSRVLLARVCGTEVGRWAEAEETARASLQARMRLWDDILHSILSEQPGKGG